MATVDHLTFVMLFLPVVILIWSSNLITPSKSSGDHIRLAFFQGHCPIQHNYCQHVCENIDNGFICKCHPGYELNNDGTSCTNLNKNRVNNLENKLPGPVSTLSADHSSLNGPSSGLDLSSVNQNLKSEVNVNVGNNDQQKPEQLLKVNSDGEQILSDINIHDQGITDQKYTSQLKRGKVRDQNQELAPLPLVLIPSCDGVFCQNNGTCVIKGAEAICNCPLGTAGRLCEKDAAVKYPKFSGNSFLALPVLKNGYKEFDISIHFKPFANNGLLLFSSESNNAKTDYFSLALVNGIVEFRFDCGTGHASLKSESPVVIGQWNHVRAKRVDNKGSLWLNGNGPVKGYSKGAYSRITLRLHVYLGGYSNMSAVSQRLGISKAYVGCVQEIKINNYKYDMRKAGLVGDGQHGLNVDDCSNRVCQNIRCENGGSCVPISADQHTCLCPLGTGGDKCQRKNKVHIPKFGGHSVLKHQGLGRSSLSFTEIELVFKPSHREGLLLYNGYTKDRKGDFIMVAMREGHLEFQFDLGTGPAVLRSLESVSLNQWHWVRLSRTGLQGIMEIDEQMTIQGMSLGAFTQLTLLQDLYIGGHSNFDETVKSANMSLSFQGCIQKIVINDQPLKLIGNAVHGVNIESCEHPCVGEPCMNDGECIPDKNVYTCSCPLGFTNTNCETKLEDPVRKPMFNGNSFLMYTERKIAKRVDGSKIDIQMKIKPESPDGLIFWSSHNQPMLSTEDFLALGFVDGALQFRYNLGSGEAVISYNDTKLYDGKWHTIRAQRNRQIGYLEVDKQKTVEGSSSGSYTMLNTNKVLYLGGMPDVAQNTLRKFTKGFVGCISYLVLAEDYSIKLVGKAQSGRNIQPCPGA